MTITVRSLTNPFAFITFTWSDDGEECSFIECGTVDGELEAVLLANGHEGADVPGYAVTID